MRFIAASLAIFCCNASAQTGTPDFVGYVFDMSGSWRTAPQYAVDLVRGQGLRNGDVVKLSSFKPNAFIRIGMWDGTVRTSSCAAAPKDCTAPLNIGVAAVDQSLSRRFQDIWHRLTSLDAAELVFTMSRGPGMDPEEAVLPLKGDKPDLAPALKSMSAASYEVDLKPLTEAGEPVHLRVRWTPPAASVTGPSVEPGLYGLQLLAGGGAAGTAVVVLVSSPERAAQWSRDFAEASHLAARWPAEVGAESRHYFLSSVLSELAKESASRR